MTIYYPILKKGNSEIKALEELSKQFPSSHSKITPIIEAPQKSNPDNWERDFKTFGNYLSRKIPDLNFAFQYSTAFSNLDENPENSWKSTTNLNIVEYIHTRLVEGCKEYIPCFNYDDKDWIIESIPDSFIDTVIIRIEPHKFEAGIDKIVIPGIKNKFQSKFPDKHIIWLIDFYKTFSDLDRASNLISLLTTDDSGSNVIFGATSCPEDATSVTHSEFSVASNRNDLLSFFTLKKQCPELSFADYTVRLKPVPTNEQRSGINMNNTYLKIFYTTNNHYMIAKSGLIKKQKTQVSHLTIQETCKILIDSPHYSGETYSWGDKKIHECANGKLDIHDHQVPIQIGINHHLVSTLNQL